MSHDWTLRDCPTDSYGPRLTGAGGPTGLVGLGFRLFFFPVPSNL